MYKMERRFFLASQTEPRGSHVALESLQARLRDEQASGLIEVEVGAAKRVIIIYSHGVQAGVYLLEDGLSRPFHLAELSTLFGGAPFTLRTVRMPDRAGRAVWLTLESRKSDQFEVRGQEAWSAHLGQWQQENFNGVVEVESKTSQGFAVFSNGACVPNESVYFNGVDFSEEFPAVIGPSMQTWQTTTYVPNQPGRAWQCMALRQGATHWANGVLLRFQNVAGMKFLQIVEKELATLIRPWQWNISLRETKIVDEHFFTNTESTAHAYRALFMGMGTQMSFVIGGALTQRAMSEIFEELEQDKRGALEAQRLIPAAFSN